MSEIDLYKCKLLLLMRTYSLEEDQSEISLIFLDVILTEAMSERESYSSS